MGSDRARNSYDLRQLYRSVVMQQGRVQVEADWNEAQFINSEEIRNEALDFVGPSGTPDNGYAITFPSTFPPFDFEVSGGIMYVGGVRVWALKPIQYGQQSDWLDAAIDPEWVPVPTANPGNEYIYLVVREQEVSAVEDSDLKDVALGGPDTAQRTRLIQHIERMATQGTDCASALEAARKQWASQEGLFFSPNTMRLHSRARLQVSFVSSGASTPCDPTAQGGYLGADNQMIRVLVSSFSPGKNTGTLLWGFDDASFLYRVNVVDPQTLTLQSAPVDAEHQPQGGQAVEVLMDAAELSNGQYVAAPVGAPFTLGPSPYNPDTLTLTLPSALPSAYGDGIPAYPHPPQVYLRVWQQHLTFTPGTAVTLGDTGVAVTLETAGNVPFHVGDYWMFAVRPSTPQGVYPERYLQAFQPAEGPREWLCPLGIIEWTTSGGQVLFDCRNKFDNLVELTGQNLGGCCTVNLGPSDLTANNTLQSVLDKYRGSAGVNICLRPGEYDLPAPLLLTADHSNFTIEACAGGVTLAAAQGAEAAFLQGLVVLQAAQNVTFRGIQFKLPLVPLGSTTLATSGVAEAASVLLSFGLRPIDCTGLTIEGCQFTFTPTTNIAMVAVGILAAGECLGLRVMGSQFQMPALTTTPGASAPSSLNDASVSSFFAGFVLFPTTVSNDVPPTETLKAGATADVLSAWLNDALFRDNLFIGLSVCVLVYADCGLVDFESNTIQNCLNGFWFLSLPSLAYADNLADISVAAPYAAKASALQNAIYTAVGHPAVKLASATLRGFPLPSDYKIAQPIHVVVQKVAATTKDAAAVQSLFARAMEAATPVSPAPAQPAKTVKLTNLAGTLTEHPVQAPALPQFDVSSLNQSYDIIEKLAFAQEVTRGGIPLGLHFSDNDVSTLRNEAASGLGLLLWSLGKDDRDAIGVTGTTFIGANGTLPMALIMGTSRCMFTGNMVLNEAAPATNLAPGQGTVSSLWLFPISVTSSIDGSAVSAVAVTGNVFRGLPILPARNLNPAPPAPMDTWDFFNAET